MNMTSKELLRLLLKEGWHKDKQEGSHLRLKKERISRHNPSYAQQRFSKRVTYEYTQTSRAKITALLVSYL